MIRRRFLRFHAPDIGDNAPAPTPETDSAKEKAADTLPVAPPVPTPPAAVPAMTIGQTLKAAVAHKATLQADLAEAIKQRDAHAATIATLTADLTTARTTIGTLNTDLTAARADVTRLTSEQRTVAEQVAQLGFSLDKLPEQQEGPVASSLDDLQTAYATEKDPEKKAKIYENIQAARAAERAAAKK